MKKQKSHPKTQQQPNGNRLNSIENKKQKISETSPDPALHNQIKNTHRKQNK
jgi:hypothetical protein